MKIFLYLFILLILLSSASYFKNKNNLMLCFLDVGHGDAAYVRFPNGNSMLIDGGESSAYQDHGKKTLLPFLKQEGSLHVNYMVVTHPHKDHMSGLLELIKFISVDTVILSPYRFNTKLYNDFLFRCTKKSIPVRYVIRGDQLYPDPDCRVYVLHPSSELSVACDFSGTECNNSSVVLKIQYGEHGILLTGDIEKAAERSLTCYGHFLESEILKVAHHGSIHSSSMDLLTCIQPLIAVISAAERSRFNQPAALTLDRLRFLPSSIMQTSKEGALIFTMNDREIKKVNWRNKRFFDF